MFCAYCGSARPAEGSSCSTCGKALAPDVVFFNVGSTKLVLMSIATVGIYEAYWLYKNWVAEKALSGAHVIPALRAFFAPLFLYSLAVRIKHRAISMRLPTDLRPGQLATAFFLIHLTIRAPDPLWLLTGLTGFVLVPIQNAVAQINSARGIGVGREARFSGANIAWLAVSGVLWALVIIGTFVPETE